MILRNLIFKTEVVKQRLRAGMVSHHEQQASKCHGEQQHRELWPAYNANVAPSQASTEGLFQQTKVISTVQLANNHNTWMDCVEYPICPRRPSPDQEWHRKAVPSSPWRKVPRTP